MRAATPQNPSSRPGLLRRMGRVMNRAIGLASYRFHVAAANVWRDQYNPLRGLTITRAIHLLEEGERGAFADLQWTYRFVEMQDATIGALIERRTSAIQKLDWDIKTRDQIPAEKQAIANRQAAALREAYEKVSNLSAAFEHLAMASFRGFTHLEKIQDENGDVTEFASVDQWFWVRKGLYGDWQINRDSKFGINQGDAIPASRFISREVARPINRVALISFVRKGLSQKDWDGFIESYGIPAVFIIMPPDVPQDKEQQYYDLADETVSDARGALPHGSDVKTVDNGARGNNPFKDHIQYQDEQIVMRGTGGLLTMLTQSGSGTLAGSAHAETFESIAKAEAAEISEILRKCFDAEILDRVTPGEKCYAYFELSANEETDTGEVIKDVSTLGSGGYRVTPEWIKEKTGYDVTVVPATTPQPLLNREPADDSKSTEWTPFARETGTLGIPRSIMPQVQNGNRAAMVNFLRSHGVDYVRTEIKPSDLKPTQAEYSSAKLEKAKTYEGRPRAILVSSDNHVLDGHHQYLAALHQSPNLAIPVFQIKAPAMHALGLMLRMPSTAQEETPLKNRMEHYDSFKDFVRAARPGETWPSDEKDSAFAELRSALAEDMQPLCDAMFSAHQNDDSPAFRAALKKISRELPNFTSVPKFEALLSSEMVNAWIGEDEPIRNAGTSGGAVKGWETRRHNGWQAKPRAHDAKLADLIDDALDNSEDASDRVEIFGEVTRDEAELLGIGGGYKRGLSRHSIRHMMKSHGDPDKETPRGQIAITREDIRRIPEIIAKSQAANHAGTFVNAETIRYFYDDPKGGTTTVLDEVRSRRRQLVPIQLMKFQGSGIRDVSEPGNKKRRGSTTSE